MKLLKGLKNNRFIRISIIFLGLLLLLKLLFTCNIFVEYLYVIDFINWRFFYFMYSSAIAKFTYRFY
jgi:hypothetical protein